MSQRSLYSSFNLASNSSRSSVPNVSQAQPGSLQKYNVYFSKQGCCKIGNHMRESGIAKGD